MLAGSGCAVRVMKLSINLRRTSTALFKRKKHSSSQTLSFKTPTAGTTNSAGKTIPSSGYSSFMHSLRTSASTVLSMTYDVPTVLSTQHPSIQRVNEFNDRFVISMRLGAHLVEFFPWMLHIPARFAKWKRDAQESFEEFSVLFEQMFYEVEKKIVCRSVSFLSWNLLILDNLGMDRKRAMSGLVSLGV
jgi:hypothetical protein